MNHIAGHIESYEAAFAGAQQEFDGQLDSTDHSHLVVAPNAQVSSDFLTDSQPKPGGFFPVTIDTESLRYNGDLFLNRVLLIHNARLKALSPAVVTQDPAHPARYQITMLDQPYDPVVGISPGIHFSVSVKAQTRVRGFGGHGAAGGLEQGHFGAVLIGASDDTVATALKQSGDSATHRLLDDGISESMARRQLLNLPIITKQLPVEKVKLQLYWHSGLETDTGPAAADYPNATKLMLGAGVRALGSYGLERARLLVNDAIKGAT